jgi:hypothetical protein
MDHISFCRFSNLTTTLKMVGSYTTLAHSLSLYIVYMERRGGQ